MSISMRKNSSLSNSISNHNVPRSGNVFINKSKCSVKKENSQGSTNQAFIDTEAIKLHKDHQVSGDQKSIQNLKTDSILQNNVTLNQPSVLTPDQSNFLHMSLSDLNQSIYSKHSTYPNLDSNRSGYSCVGANLNRGPVAQQRTEQIDVSISKIKLKLQDIQDAHMKIKDDIVTTPVLPAKYLGKNLCNVYFKCEYLQYTGSFKARGVCNVIKSMKPTEKSKGVTVSGGRNFMQAVTHYGFRQSVPVNVVVARDSPIADRQRYKEDFAIVKVHGDNANEAAMYALGYSKDIGAPFIQSWNSLDLIAGYGSMGLELLTQLDRLDAVICPVGTGGLVASLILAIKSLKPKCLIYITVDESWICRAMIMLMEREKMLVEGAAACPVAAIMAEKVPELKGMNVVCILSGGNISSGRVGRVIDRGMAAEGRLCKFSAALPDVPCAMARLLARVADCGADVRSVVPERAWMRSDIFTVSVNMLIETTDHNHAKELERKLVKDYPNSSFIAL